MNTQIKNLRKAQDGFTLVELAVVMIIIGLLIGGILKGQELIANARVTSTISQMEGIGAAVDGFTDAYNAYPGDMNDAAGANGRLVNCAAPCNNGSGDGRISVAIGSAPAIAGGPTGEGVNFFAHLAAADFITGMDSTGNVVAFGRTNPSAPVGGGFTVGDTRAGAPISFAAANFRVGTYVVINGVAGAVAANSGVLATSQAARIDRKLDDGIPTTGIVIGDSLACGLAATGGYDEGNQSSVCAIAFRM